MTTTDPIADYLDHFRARVLQDALNEATAAYWLRRAEAFENARTGPEDAARGRPGPLASNRADSEPQSVRDARLAATAQACRNKAGFIEMYPGEIEAIVWAALTEATATSTAPASNTADPTNVRSAA